MLLLKHSNDYYTTRMNEIREYTGDDRIRRNFIPQIQRDTIDILVQDGMYSFDSLGKYLIVGKLV
jgi:hypothetical protein